MLIRIKPFRFVLNIFIACGTHKTIQPSDARCIDTYIGTYLPIKYNYIIAYGWWMEIQLQNKCALYING